MMRRQARTFPALDEPLLVMGMPPTPFLLATILAALVPVMSGFHPVAVVVALGYPIVLGLLRRLGRQDPDRLTVLIEHAVFFRRLYQPVGFIGATRALPVDRRSLVP